MKRLTTILAACSGSFLLGAFITAPDDPKEPLTADMEPTGFRLCRASKQPRRSTN